MSPSERAGDNAGAQPDKPPETLYAQPQTAVHALSKREREVLIHLAAGLTVRETSEYMQLSPKTVDAYKTSLMFKLNVHNRASLIRVAMRSGLIPR